MTARTLQVTDADLHQIDAGVVVRLTDSNGEPVAVYSGVLASSAPDTVRHINLTDVEVDDLRRGEQWTVTDVFEPSHGWTVRMAEVTA